jgi:hypothetical protein
MHKNAHFTKTGSGQTWEKLLKNRPFSAGVCFEEHCVAQRGARQSVAGGGSWGKPWSPEFVAGLSPKTRAIVGGAFDMHGAFDHRGEAKL